jgi:hypothetical protein
MNNKIHGQRRKPRFQPMGLIFYCYLLIPLNELAPNVLKINKLKNKKKFIVIINRSIQNARKGVFSGVLHPDTPLAPLFRGEFGRCEIES